MIFQSFSRFFLQSLGLFTTLFILQACSPAEEKAVSNTPPETTRQQISDDFFETSVADPYRWLEDIEAEQTMAWARAQDAYARQALEIDPDLLKAIEEKISADANADNMALPLRAGNFLYYILVSQNFANPALVRKNLETGETEVVVEPGTDFVVHDFRPDPEGKILAYALEHKETGERVWTFRDMTTGAELAPRLTGGSINGNPWVGTTFVYYIQRDQEAGTPAKIMALEVGDEAKPRVLFENTASPGARTFPDVSADGRVLVLSVFEKSNANRVLIKSLGNSEKNSVELFDGQEGGHTFIGSQGDTLYFMTSFDTPNGRLVSFRLGDQDLTEITLVPEGGQVLTQAYYFGGRLLGVYMENGFQVLKIFDAQGVLQHTITPPKGLLWNDFPQNWPPFSGGKGPKAYFRSLALMDAGIFEIDMNEGSITQIASRGQPNEPGKYTIKQVFFTSNDGTEVPMTIIHRSDLELDGNTPVLLNVYGAYGFTFIPFFNPMYRPFIEAGGIYAVPNIRGGGIYGQDWYEGGRGNNKINSAQDTIFAAKWFLENGYTNPGRLAVTGNSAGTVPAAVAAISSPDLFGALLLEVPLADMIRYQQWTKGWNTEFGGIDTAEAFAASLAVSPYHLLVGKRTLPPTLITAGDKDQVAHPSHAYKLAAALQFAQDGEHVPLLHIDWGTGHGSRKTTEQRIETWTYELAFLFRVLEMEFE